MDSPIRNTKRKFNDVYLLASRVTTSANGCTLIFVYMTYTMLPVRLREALIGGLLLSFTHLYLGIYGSHQTDWSQVSKLCAHIGYTIPDNAQEKQ